MELEVAPLPCWKSLSEEERQRVVRALLREVEAEARAQGRPVMGARAVQEQPRLPGPSVSSVLRDLWDMHQRARPCGSCASSTMLSSRHSEKPQRAGGRGTSRPAFLSSPSRHVSCRVVSLEFFDTLSGEDYLRHLCWGGRGEEMTL